MMKKLIGTVMMVALVLVGATTLYAQAREPFSIDWFSVTGGGNSKSDDDRFEVTGSVSVFGGGAATSGDNRFTLNSGLYPQSSGVPTVVDLATDSTATGTSTPLVVVLVGLVILSGLVMRQIVARQDR